MFSFRDRARSRLCLAILVLLCAVLTGCAAHRAYQEGEQLLAQDKVEEGLQKLAEARAREPGNGQYGIAYLRARERAGGRWLEQADLLQAQGKHDAARAIWLRVLSIDPVNERAQAGLRAQESAARGRVQYDAAAAALAGNQVERARQLLQSILAERPNDADASAMMRRVAALEPPLPPLEVALAPALRKPVSIEFRDAPLRQVFEVLSRSAELNFVFDKDVKTDTRTSIFLKNSTVEAAVHYLLLSNQLEQQAVDSNTILIYPNLPAKVKDYQEVRVKTFYLAYAEAKNVANTLKTILKVRDVVTDDKLNLLILRDSADIVRLAEKLVATQDVAEPEVMLDVEVLEVQRSRIQELGIAWPSGVTLTPLTSVGGAELTISTLSHLHGSTIGVSGVDATINANAKDGDANLLANPRIRVRNKEKAKVLIGDKVPNITTTISPGAGGFASESVNYVDVGLTLSVEPTISLNNEVAIRIALEVSNLVSQLQSKSGTVAYQIGTRQASTMLQLRDGETQVLAGLIDRQERNSGNKIPGIGDVPLLGRLFGSVHDDNQKTEIVMAITPHLIRNVQRVEASMAEFSAGTETSARRRPDTAQRQPVQREAAAPVAAPLAAPAPVTAVPAGAIPAGASHGAGNGASAVAPPPPTSGIAPDSQMPASDTETAQ